MICQCDLKVLIERQKRFEQILFVQCQTPLQQPLRGIIVRKEDVVHVHPHASLQTRKNFEKLVTDVAAKLHRVTRIDDQNVVRVETLEEANIDLLDAPGDQLNAELRTVEAIGRIRFDARESAALICG